MENRTADEPVIRRACEADVSAVRRMQVAWAEEGITGGYAASSTHAIRDAVGPYFLVAEVDTNVVGYTIGSLRCGEDMWIIAQGARYLEIEDVYVLPEFRRRGLGTMLVQDLLTRARREGIKRVNLFTATKSVREILRFYERLGFASWGIQLFQQL